MDIRCIFGHDREYVAAQHDPAMFFYFGPSSWTEPGSLVRWLCRRCGVMAEDKLKGYYAVEFGKLIPDKKAWANIEKD